MSDPYGTIGIYRKGGSMSFLENENQMVIDAEYSYIGEQLVEDWVNSNLDEGQFYADKKTGEITDRYDFNYYMPDNLDPDLTNIKSGFDLLRGGNPRGLIPFSNALGLIKPGSGYPIQVKP